MKYIVLVSLKARHFWDDTIEGEYTGICHDTKEAAEKERKKAMKEPDVYTAWIEEKEDI